MIVYKCKMCGGTLEIRNDETVSVCEYCGTKQTLPKLNDEYKANLYDRANHFRRNNEFDKATEIYEQILNEDITDAESYWSLILCRYGIEYIHDPKTNRRIPTINRSQYTSIFTDENYKSAIHYADTYQKCIYETEATIIDKLQKRILEISQKEEPFDVFICYKETDSNGRRTLDSVLATELYHELLRNGFRVFFSRITLEDKLGEEFEPYIFSAISTAKVMVVLGTKPEHFSSPWVKNEWSRFLALIKSGEKRILIPAYKNMSPYDLPKDFSHLQAQDMSRLGFLQDLSYNITKIIKTDSKKRHKTQSTSSSVGLIALIKRALLFLEDQEWEKAEINAERVLDSDPENAYAYTIKLLVELKISHINKLGKSDIIYDSFPNYQKALRFADKELKECLLACAKQVRINNQEQIYNDAKTLLYSNDAGNVMFAKEMFNSILDYKDASELFSKCDEQITFIEQEKLKKQKKQKYVVIGFLVTLIIATITLISLNFYFNHYIPQQEYETAINDLNNGEYYSAYLYFKDSNYERSQELKHDAQYGYIKEHYDRTNHDTYLFLKELKAINYEDAKNLFEDLYKWKVNITYCNTNPNDESTYLGYVPTNCSFYHIGISVSGGEPNENIKTYTKTIWPNDYSYTSDWYWEDFSNGTSHGVQWDEGFTTSKGTLTIEIYDAETDEFIDRVSLQVKN